MDVAEILETRHVTNTLQLKNFVKFCAGHSLDTNLLAAHSYLLQNMATNTKFSFIGNTYWPDSCHYSSFFPIDYLTKYYFYIKIKLIQ